MALWSMWRRRNGKLWEEKEASNEEVFHRTNMFFNNWNKARRSEPSHYSMVQHSQVLHWIPPEPGCVRDERGRQMMARAETKMPCMDAQLGEAWGLLEVINFMQAKGYVNVIFEMDSKEVGYNLKSSNRDDSDIGSVIQHCRNLLINFK